VNNDIHKTSLLKKRYRNNALREWVWRGLRVEYRLFLGLDGARGI
jgi:hypothetical protein